MSSHLYLKLTKRVSRYCLNVESAPLIQFPAPAQILLRWATQRGIAVIPKTNNAERLKSNLACVNFDLTETELKQLSSLNIGLRVRAYILLFQRDF